ncbi:MAG: hypothetical protein JW384_00340 [Nitrosomonadaceae bacterium]|nr:hypothetical protein [Nitrosomonadaceae bacterium]
MPSLLPRNITVQLALVSITLFLGCTYVLGFDAKFTAIGIVLPLIAINLYRHFKHFAIPTLVALCFSVFITTAHYYVYDTPNIYLGHMHIFPLVMWVGGLLLSREIYLLLPVRYKLFAALILYWIVMFSLEYIGYYWVGIRTNTGHPGFLGTEVLHGNLAVHLFYPTAGPIFIIVTELIKRHSTWIR